MEMLNQKVKVTTRVGNVVFEGTVIKQQNHIVWVELDNNRKDVLKFFTDWDNVEVIKEEKTASELLEDWLNENKFDWDAYGDNDNIDYHIDGFTYTITCYYDSYSNEWILSTTHKERFKNESDFFNVYGDISKADANEVRRKTLKGVKTYIEKWTDK